MEKQLKLIFIITTLVLVTFFFVFITFYQEYSKYNAEKQLETHAVVISNSLWRYETEEPVAYLKLAARSNSYLNLTVYDEGGKSFVSVDNKKNTDIEKFFQKLNLLPTMKLEKPVIHKKRTIGKIVANWQNKSIFVYFYVLLFLTLLLMVIWFFLSLIHAKKNLETRVMERTYDLNKSKEELKVNKERLDLALKGANDGIWDCDLKNETINFDARYYTLSGYEPYEFPEDLEEWRKRVHKDDIEKVISSGDDYIENRTERYDIEYRFLRKDGGYMWLRSRGKIVERDELGNPLRFSGTHSDITERMEAEKELQKLRNYLSNIIDSMPSVLIGVDTRAEVTQWNKNAEKITGIEPKMALGKPLQSVFPDLSDEIENVSKAISSRKEQQNKKKAKLADNKIRYEDVTVYPLIANGIEGAVIRVDDVTDQVQLEEMMVQSEKMLSVGGLAAGMAHEINNPLAGMIQTANVLKSRLEDTNMPANIKAAKEVGVPIEGIRDFMEKRGILRMTDAINESGCRAAEIVENMLSFARKSDAAVSTHHPSRLLDQILELATTDYDLKKQYDFKTIKIVKEYEEDLPVICCEGAKIQQVLLNILRNGAQAMQTDNTADKREPEFHLRLSNESDTGMIRIEIEDNGPGISQEIQSRIFEPFFTTKPPGSGTGLGLSVSYFIITENHKGTMEVESTPGMGAKFIIRLPVER